MGTAGSPLPLLLAQGEQDLRLIDKAYWSQALGSYSEEPQRSPWEPPSMAYCWDVGAQISALTAASHVKPKEYLPRLSQLVTATQRYLDSRGPVAGLGVLPDLKDSDRFYDDNAWIAIAMADAYPLTRNPEWLALAKTSLDFALSGEDSQLGGGVFWRENERKTKNTCSNAPTAVAALRYFQITGERAYFDRAQRILAWTRQTLQDKDGLYFDSVSLEGKVDKTKWTYNTALMIEADVLMFEITKNPFRLVEANRLALAAQRHWIDPKTGAIKDDGSFAHLLCDAWWMLDHHQSDSRWSKVILRAVHYAQTNTRRSDGFFGKRWDEKPARDDKPILLNQASVARAVWQAVRMLGSEKGLLASSIPPKQTKK